MKTYVRSECVVFKKTREEWGCFSNMAAGYPLWVCLTDGTWVEAPTSEALYQACRYPHLPDTQGVILKESNPMRCKMVARIHRDATREGWDKDRVPIMLWALSLKAQQHGPFLGTLLSTGKRRIVEDSGTRGDFFWGAQNGPTSGTLEGTNTLGELLVHLRDDLRDNPTKVHTVYPPLLREFMLYGMPIAATSYSDRSEIPLDKVRSGP